MEPRFFESRSGYQKVAHICAVTWKAVKEFKGMLWGQKIIVYTDHKNLIQDALGLLLQTAYTAGGRY